jgi:hypothetical protein
MIIEFNLRNFLHIYICFTLFSAFYISLHVTIFWKCWTSSSLYWVLKKVHCILENLFIKNNNFLHLKPHKNSSARASKDSLMLLISMIYESNETAHKIACFLTEHGRILLFNLSRPHIKHSIRWWLSVDALLFQ